MPLYEYVCEKCDTRFEQLIRNADEEEKLRCPDCGGKKVARQFSAFAVGGGSTGSGGSGTSSSSSDCPTGTCPFS